MQRFSVNGKVALVSGGGVIGAGIAHGLLECGAAVVVAGCDTARLASTVPALERIGPPCSSLPGDGTSEQACHQLVAATVRRHGRLDILVNASTGDEGGPSEFMMPGWHEAIEGWLRRAFMMSRAARPEMKKAGGGKIINVVPMASYIGSGRWNAYRTTRRAFNQLARDCAAAWGSDNIQVNTIVPGYIDSPVTKAAQAMAEFHAAAIRHTAAGRLGTPQDFAGVAAFLASPASDFITGASIAIDGGLLWSV